MSKSYFRTGRSIGHSILHADGRLFYMAHSVQSAELLCKALNALWESGFDSFPDALDVSKREEPPQFSALINGLKEDAETLFPGSAFELEEAAMKQVHLDAVDRILNNLLMRGLLLIDPKNAPTIHPTDEEIDEASVELIKDVASKGNFMDGLSMLVKVLRQWKRRGKVEVTATHVNIDKILAPVTCNVCEGEGEVGQGRIRESGVGVPQRYVLDGVAG